MKASHNESYGSAITTGGGSPTLPWIGHDDFMSEFAKRFCNPPELRTGFSGDTSSRYLGKVLSKPRRGNGNCGFFGEFAFFIQVSLVCSFVPEIDSSRGKSGDSTRHGWSPFWASSPYLTTA